MSYQFKILEKHEILGCLPLIFKLNQRRIPENTLKDRLLEMAQQQYECAAIFKNEAMVGVCGLWYCTRHYSGRSVEVDHVFIEEAHRGKGLGKTFFKWLYTYLKQKGYETIELNTYVTNTASHKFYYNEGFKILGYHFLKTL